MSAEALECRAQAAVNCPDWLQDACLRPIVFVLEQLKMLFLSYSDQACGPCGQVRDAHCPQVHRV